MATPATLSTPVSDTTAQTFTAYGSIELKREERSPSPTPSPHNSLYSLSLASSSGSYTHTTPQPDSNSVIHTPLSESGEVERISGKELDRKLKEIVLEVGSPAHYLPPALAHDGHSRRTDPDRKRGRKTVREKVQQLASKTTRTFEPMRKYVIGRNGHTKVYSQDKLVDTIIDSVLFEPSLDHSVVDVYKIAASVEASIVDKMRTSDISKLLAEQVASMATEHPDFDTLAVRLAVSDMHKSTFKFADLKPYLKTLYRGVIPPECVPADASDYQPIQLKQSISTSSFNFAMKFSSVLQKVIQYERDYDYDWFGFQTMMKQYTLKFPYMETKETSTDGRSHGDIKYASLERPQHSYLRFALEVLVPDPTRFFSHIRHLANPTATVWHENYDTFTGEAETDGETIQESLESIYATMVGIYNGDDSVLNEEVRSHIIGGEKKEKKSERPCYAKRKPNPSISDLLNPFTLPAKKLILLYKSEKQRGESDMEIFRTFVSKHLHARTVEEDYDLLINVTYLYHLLSLRFLCPPTTVFQPGKKFVSCFLVGKPGDSIPLIFEAIAEGAALGAGGGGYSTVETNVRAKRSYIAGSNSISHGIMPIISCMDEVVHYVKQAGNAGRSGPNTTYLETYHAELYDFLESLTIESGAAYRMKELKGAVWVDELLLRRAQNGEKWTLFSPNHVPNLACTWGAEFEKEYVKYENDASIPKITLEANEVVMRIVETLHDAGHGVCNVLHGDNFNRYSMLQCPQEGVKQQSSNICLEIRQPSTPHETATCVLLTLPIPPYWMREKHVDTLTNLMNEFSWLNGCEPATPKVPIEGQLRRNKPYPVATGNAERTKHFLQLNEKWIKFGHSLRKGATSKESHGEKTIAWNPIRQVSGFGNYVQSCMINQTVYPSYTSLIGGMHQRAVGLGLQGFQNLLFSLKLPYDSPMAMNVLYKINEASMFGAYENSIDLAELYGTTPFWDTLGEKYSLDAKGMLPFDLYYKVNPDLTKKATVEEVSSESIGEILMEDPSFFHRRTIFNSETKWKAPTLDWSEIRKKLVHVGGKYNGLLKSIQPTATSSIVLGFFPSIEPITYLMGKHKVIFGEYIIILFRLVRKLIKMNLWGEEVRDAIKTGKFHELPQIPENLKQLFKTAWLIDYRAIILMFYHAQMTSDQTTSMNLWTTIEKLSQAQLANPKIWTPEKKQELRLRQLRKIVDMIYFGSTICGTGLSTLVYYLHKNFVAPTDLSSFTVATTIAVTNSEQVTHSDVGGNSITKVKKGNMETYTDAIVFDPSVETGCGPCG